MLSYRRPRWLRAALAASLSALALLVAGCGAPGAQPGPAIWSAPVGGARGTEGTLAGDWLRFGYDPARDSVNPTETALSPSTTSYLLMLFARMACCAC